MRQALYTTDEVAAKYGLAKESIDHYVSLGLLRPMDLSGFKFFASSDLIRIEIILKGKRFGFSLREICLLIEGAEE